jgi:hypothetical protein
VVASLMSNRFSLISGGLTCVGAVALVCGLLPGFVRYKSEPALSACGPDMGVPGGAGFRRAPEPGVDRHVPTQGNNANADIDREKTAHVSLWSQLGLTRHSGHPANDRHAKYTDGHHVTFEQVIGYITYHGPDVCSRRNHNDLGSNEVIVISLKSYSFRQVAVLH